MQHSLIRMKITDLKAHVKLPVMGAGMNNMLRD
jgi:hypothetical protein